MMGFPLSQRIGGSAESFWQTLDCLTVHLENWDTAEDDVPEPLYVQCQCICHLLKKPFAQTVCADPRHAVKVKAVREAYAHKWSVLNSRLEFKVAEEIWPEVQTYQGFQRLTDTHPLFWNSDNLVKAESDLLVAQGIDLKKARVCMIGPGAIPYTALAFAHAGAHVSVVDCYAPACEWVGKWFGKLLPEGTYDIVRGFAQDQSFTGYDVVIVASMLSNREQVMEAVEASAPGHVFVRTTANRRPMSMLLPQPDEADLQKFRKAVYVGETNPPLQVGNFSLLFRYP